MLLLIIILLLLGGAGGGVYFGGVHGISLFTLILILCLFAFFTGA